MINLIPPEGKKVIIKEYLARVATVWSYICMFACVGGGVALIPTYVFFTHQLQTMESGPAEHTTEIVAEYQKTLETLKEATVVASQLGRTTPSVEASAVVHHLEEALTDDIALGGLAVSLDDSKTKIEARGVARTRDSLRRFVEALKKDAFFAEAKIPVSDLAKDTNLPFSVSLTLRP